MYHRTRALYVPGDRIPAGNWGRVVLGFGPKHLQYGREYLFEQVRLREFDALPSRMTSAFVFPDLEAAQAFRPSDPHENLYEVELATPDAWVHIADMAWTEAFLEARSFDEAEGLRATLLARRVAWRARRASRRERSHRRREDWRAVTHAG